MTFYVFQNAIFVPTPRFFRGVCAVLLAFVVLIVANAVGFTLVHGLMIAILVAWFFSITSGSLLRLKSGRLICTKRFFGLPDQRVELTRPTVSADFGWDLEELVVLGGEDDAEFVIQVMSADEAHALGNAITAWLDDPR